tara:strand:- start:1415 stop:1684 length:270 start_codon:yes stop_codon:yes gene_type:complete
MSTFNYIITTSIRDHVLINTIRHGECGKVISTSKNRSHGPKTFTVRSARRWADLTAILAGNGDYNSTIVRLGSQSGEPLTKPVTVKTVN